VVEPSWEEAKRLSLIPGQKYSLSVEKRQLLYWCAVTIPRGGLIVELGVCHGGTAMMLAYVAKCLEGLYAGVDDWSLEGSCEEVWAHMMAGGVQLNAALFEGDSRTITLPPDPIDLLFIDGGHQIGVVDQDCARWIPLVRPGGLVAFDDYTGKALPREEDCHWAVRESAERWTSEWETVGYWQGLLVRRKPV